MYAEESTHRLEAAVIRIKSMDQQGLYQRKWIQLCLQDSQLGTARCRQVHGLTPLRSRHIVRCDLYIYLWCIWVLQYQVYNNVRTGLTLCLSVKSACSPSLWHLKMLDVGVLPSVSVGQGVSSFAVDKAQRRVQCGPWTLNVWKRTMGMVNFQLSWAIHPSLSVD